MVEVNLDIYSLSSVDSRTRDQREDWGTSSDVSWNSRSTAGASWTSTRTSDVSWTSTRTADVFRGRARLQEGRGKWTLLLHQVELGDEGQYRCRVDFKSSPTHNAKVFLHVVGEWYPWC